MTGMPGLSFQNIHEKPWVRVTKMVERPLTDTCRGEKKWKKKQSKTMGEERRRERDDAEMRCALPEGR